MASNGEPLEPAVAVKSRTLSIATSLALAVLCLLGAQPGFAREVEEANRNRADRLEWFRDQGFGLFIHLSLDSQLGAVLSHSMVGASDDYLKRFTSELPRSFNPRKFAPRDWAALAKLAGMRYVVFAAKHHSGFCMFETATTDFGIMKTPFGRDVTREVLDAFRAEGIAPGLYYSPDDFIWLYRHGKMIARGRPDLEPPNNPGLLAYDQAQVRELLTKYGTIDIMFFDGPIEGLRKMAWELQPNIVVTRGAIRTPEEHIPGSWSDEPWESCIPMGTSFEYKPTNESYRSGGELIGLLIETRAKGGNLLLGVGPKPDGELPIEQEERLREIALWMFVNGEAIYGVRPWVVTNEDVVWFTRKKGEDTLYAIVRGKERWKYGEWKEIVVHSAESTPETQVSILGQNDQVLEYHHDVVPKTTWKQGADGLHIRAMRAQRLYNDRHWPNPVVLKITHVKPALTPPRCSTLPPAPRNKAWILAGEVQDLGKATSVEVGFEYRPIGGFDADEHTEPWRTTAFEERKAPGRFTAEVNGWRAGQRWEVRAVVKHPLLTIYGKEVEITVR